MEYKMIKIDKVKKIKSYTTMANVLYTWERVISMVNNDENDLYATLVLKHLEFVKDRNNSLRGEMGQYLFNYVKRFGHSSVTLMPSYVLPHIYNKIEDYQIIKITTDDGNSERVDFRIYHTVLDVPNPDTSDKFKVLVYELCTKIAGKAKGETV